MVEGKKKASCLEERSSSLLKVEWSRPREHEGAVNGHAKIGGGGNEAKGVKEERKKSKAPRKLSPREGNWTRWKITDQREYPMKKGFQNVRGMLFWGRGGGRDTSTPGWERGAFRKRGAMFQGKRREATERWGGEQSFRKELLLLV